MIRRRIIAWLLAGSNVACGTKINPGLACPQPLAPVTYSAQLEPLMVDECVSCHSASAVNRDAAPTDVNLDTYQAVRDSAEIVNQDMMSGRMPQDDNGQPTFELTDEQRCLVDGWMRGGYLQ